MGDFSLLFSSHFGILLDCSEGSIRATFVCPDDNGEKDIAVLRERLLEVRPKVLVPIVNFLVIGPRRGFVINHNVNLSSNRHRTDS